MTEPDCAHCNLPVKGKATIRGMDVCRPNNPGMDCYKLMVDYGHDINCKDQVCTFSARRRLRREENKVNVGED